MLIDFDTLPSHMDAGILSSASRPPVNSDDTAGVTLGPGGQLQIGGDKGNPSQPLDPDITSPDDHQQVPALDSPPPAPFITDSPPSTPNSTPELSSSESTLPNAISQIDFSWTDFPSIPTTILPAPTSIDFPTDLPLTPIPISFDTILSNSAQSAIPSTVLQPSAQIPSSLILSTLFSSSNPSSQPRSGSTSNAFVSDSITLLSSTTSNSFSSVSSHSTSVSSTISQQPSSETVIAPPIPANLNVHPATFYVGIGLGALVAVALLTALIAWWIRRQTRRRRRSAQTIVPWGRVDNYDDGELESGPNASGMDDDALAALNLGSREDLAHIQAWCSHRDRDVGEPKRAPTYSNVSLYGSNPYGRPRRTLYADQGYKYPNMEYDYNPALRHLPSHLIPDDTPARAHQCEDTLYARINVLSGINHPYGDPIHTAFWEQEALAEGPPSRSMADRLRNIGKQPTSDSPERLPSPTVPTLGKEEFEQWSTSLKSGLVNAFNAVASNLGGTAPRLKDEDGLTAPPKRSIRRRKTTASNKEKGDGSGISRHGSVATTASKPWTLEEIADGAGVVHLHLPELDKHELTPQRLPMHRPTLSFGDGESISTADDMKAGSQFFKSGDPQIALFASSKPKRAFIRPETYFSRQKSTETVNANTVSRASSIYSTRSAHSGALPRRRTSGRSRVLLPKGNPQPEGHQDQEEIESVVIAPDTISRLSSTDSSLMMFSAEGSILGPRSHADAAASRALKERQKKVIEAQTAQSLEK